MLTRLPKFPHLPIVTKLGALVRQFIPIEHTLLPSESIRQRWTMFLPFGRVVGVWRGERNTTKLTRLHHYVVDDGTRFSI